jgi:hypothetical protein
MVWSACSRKQHTILGSTQTWAKKTPFAGKNVWCWKVWRGHDQFPSWWTEIGMLALTKRKTTSKARGRLFHQKRTGSEDRGIWGFANGGACPSAQHLFATCHPKAVDGAHFRSVEQRQSKELPLKSSCLRTPIITSWHQKHQLLAADFGLLLNCKIQRIGTRRKRPRPTPGHAYSTTHEPRFYFVLKSA